MKLTPQGQRLVKLLRNGAIALAILTVLFFSYRSGLFEKFGWKPAASEVPTAVNLPSNTGFSKTAVAPVEAVNLPSTAPTEIKGPTINVLIWAWNSQMGQLFANGGSFTTKGSLMEKNNVKVRFARQDIPDQMREEQRKFAEAVSKGDKNPTDGAHFVQIMGDGAAAYLAVLSDMIKPYGMTAEVVFSPGRSLGEDGMWGPQQWLDDPASMKGAVIAGVLKDGDWNIALSYLNKNGIKNNPDPTTYDPDALNWVSTDDYIKPVQLYINGFNEERPVVRNGKRTGETKRITQVDGYVTWTPGDVTGAKEKGGLVRVLSTAPGENSEQMPNTAIGIKQWNDANPALVKAFIRASLEGGDQVRSHQSALKAASVIANNVYKEKGTGPAYWERYYNGVEEKDATGNKVQLGGSSVHNLGDNLRLFGIEGSSVNPNSPYEAVYTGFGQLVVQQYPRDVKSFPPYKEIVNTRYLQELAREMPQSDAALVPKYSEEAPITQKLGDRNWSIEFATGSSSITPRGEATLRDLIRELLNNTSYVEVNGHTDNVGSPNLNMELSNRRAEAVRAYLIRSNSTAFTEQRIRVVPHGQDQPIADNNNEAGRARNRRVQIVQGR